MMPLDGRDVSFFCTGTKKKKKKKKKKRKKYLLNNRAGHRTLFDFINTMTSSDTQIVVLLCKNLFIMPLSVEMLICNRFFLFFLLALR